MMVPWGSWWCGDWWWLLDLDDMVELLWWLVQLRWWWSDVHDDAWSTWWWSPCTWWWPWGHDGDDIMMMMIALVTWYIDDDCMSHDEPFVEMVMTCMTCRSCLWWGYPLSLTHPLIHLTYSCASYIYSCLPLQNPHTPILTLTHPQTLPYLLRYPSTSTIDLLLYYASPNSSFKHFLTHYLTPTPCKTFLIHYASLLLSLHLS